MYTSYSLCFAIMGTKNRLFVHLSTTSTFLPAAVNNTTTAGGGSATALNGTVREWSIDDTQTWFELQHSRSSSVSTSKQTSVDRGSPTNGSSTTTSGVGRHSPQSADKRRKIGRFSKSRGCVKVSHTHCTLVSGPPGKSFKVIQLKSHAMLSIIE